MRNRARLVTLGIICGVGGFGACSSPDPETPSAGSDAGADSSIPMDGSPVVPTEASAPDADTPDATVPADTSTVTDTSTSDTKTETSVADSGDAGHDATDGATPDADAGPPGPVTVLSRDGLGALANQSWAAWQDGNGAWTALTPTSTGTYVFTPTAATYGVAFDCATVNNLYADGQLYYRRSTTVHLDVGAGSNCAPAAPSPTSQAMNGTLTNLPATTSYIRTGQSDGNRTASLTVASMSATYNTFSGFTPGKTYDIAIGVADNTTMLKMLFLRGQTFGAFDAGTNLTRDVNWATEGFLPAGQNTVTISNASASTNTNIVYASNDAEFGVNLNKGVGTPGSRDFSTLPTSEQLVNDHYAVLVNDYPTNGTNTVQRFFHDAANVTVTVPPSLNVTFDAVSNVPYVRPVFALQTAYAGAQSYVFGWTYYVKQVSNRGFRVDVDPTWLSGAAPYVLTFPAFSGIGGWNDAWAPPPPVDAGAASITMLASASAKNNVTGGYEKVSSTKSGAVP